MTVQAVVMCQQRPRWATLPIRQLADTYIYPQYCSIGIFAMVGGYHDLAGWIDPSMMHYVHINVCCKFLKNNVCSTSL